MGRAGRPRRGGGDRGGRGPGRATSTRLHPGGDPRPAARAGGRRAGGSRSGPGTSGPGRDRPGWSIRRSQEMLAGVEHSFEPLTPVAFLDRAAAAHGDRIAVVDGELRLTYARAARALPAAGRWRSRRWRRRPPGGRARAEHARAAGGQLRRAVGRGAAGGDQHPALGRRGRLHPGALARPAVLVHDPVFDELVDATRSAGLASPPTRGSGRGSEYEELLAGGDARSRSPRTTSGRCCRSTTRPARPAGPRA